MSELWCTECGLVGSCDEDGCCPACGASIVSERVLAQIQDAVRLSQEKRTASALAVLKEIVSDEELCDLMREPDTGEHCSTLGRAHAAIRKIESRTSSKGHTGPQDSGEEEENPSIATRKDILDGTKVCDKCARLPADCICPTSSKERTASSTLCPKCKVMDAVLGVPGALCFDCHNEEVRNAERQSNKRRQGMSGLQIRFDDGPGPVAGRFIETEDLGGKGVCAGEWKRDGKDWLLVLDPEKYGDIRPLLEVVRAVEKHRDEYNSRHEGSCHCCACDALTKLPPGLLHTSDTTRKEEK